MIKAFMKINPEIMYFLLILVKQLRQTDINVEIPQISSWICNCETQILLYGFIFIDPQHSERLVFKAPNYFFLTNGQC